MAALWILIPVLCILCLALTWLSEASIGILPALAVISITGSAIWLILRYTRRAKSSILQFILGVLLAAAIVVSHRVVTGHWPSKYLGM